ncbi:MAG TPA: caspase family protein [Acidobacteriota bacterium]|nr:caspase family protein [Acidobacteriota bacterium]HNB70453.1 caspase family protein [Acidobacteriota bacterium]HND17800.1 caspase family protein [Acidobacteriota bacterium]HNG96092.1 caspase family protein [Acidobacteriota bacterium]HNH80940.1 caspase family protein [Acidobacteriota bacterium]
MRNHTRLLIAIVSVLLVVVPFVVASVRPTELQELPFLVMFPELNTTQFVPPQIPIPHSRLTRLEVLIPKPLSDQMTYGGIFLSINGQAANRILDKVNTPAGKLMKIDLRRLPGFLLRDGKNSIEVLAELADGREVYNACVISTPYGLPGVGVPKSGSPVEQFTGQKYALVIGISRYLYGNSLKFADADARAFRDFLLSRQGGSFRPENILLIENESATLGGIQQALETVVKQVTANDLLVFFLAGHGGPDPGSRKTRYFMTYDTGQDFTRSALPMTLLRDRLTKDLRAKRLVCFIDTCHSAGLAGDPQAGGFGMRDFGLNLINQDFESLLYGAQGIAVLTSSDIDEKSYESQVWDGHGVFTYFLLKGLKGAADVDRDNLVTAGEIFEYVRGEVPKAVESHIQLLRQKGITAELTGQHPRAAVGNNDGLQLAIVK